MFWITILIAAVAAMTFKLGALSILTAVLSSCLMAALLAIAGFVVVLLWRHVFRRER